MNVRPRPVVNSCTFECHEDAPRRRSNSAIRLGRILAVAAVASGSMLGGCHPELAQRGPSTDNDAASSRTQFVLAQAQSPPTAPLTPSPAPDRPVGLPRTRDYEPISELRDIHFDFGKAMIRPEDVKVLDVNAAWLRAHPSHLVLIEGHTDNRGTTSNKNEFNMDLGERRAQAAMMYLVAHGIDQSRITILSYGEERPKCTEQNERCWSENRRLRFLVKPR